MELTSLGHSCRVIEGTAADGISSNGPQLINAINANEVYSFHSGGAHVLLADGSVRCLSEDLDAWTFIVLCTRAGADR